MKKIILTTITFYIMTTTPFAQNFPRLDEAFRHRQLEPPTGKVKMVLDTDTYNEVDDQFALAYALLSTEKIEVEAVYAAPFHNRRSSGPSDGMEKSYEEILRLLKLLGKSSEGFAFKGADRYLTDLNNPVRSEAVTDLIERANAASPENPLYVVPIGCITNVASAILIEPHIVKNIVVVWLGGNSVYWPHQREFNLRQDIPAARVVLDSGVPFVIMPCRPVVSHFHTSIPELKHHLSGKNELSDYLYETVKEYSGGREVYSKVIWDVTAIAWLVNPQWISTTLIPSPVLTDEVTYKTYPSRHSVRMATEISRDAIFNDLFKKLNSHTFTE